MCTSVQQDDGTIGCSLEVRQQHNDDFSLDKEFRLVMQNRIMNKKESSKDLSRIKPTQQQSIPVYLGNHEAESKLQSLD